MEFSKNELAGKMFGFRRTDVMAIDLPVELDYHCPVCMYKNEVNGNFDERLHWSEYNNFIWCEVCNRDYPSCLCTPDIDKAIEVFMLSVEEALDKFAEEHMDV